MIDWIEHDGQNRPDLPKGTLVLVQLSDGWVAETPYPFEEWDWIWADPLADITRYRVVEPHLGTPHTS